MTYSEAYTILAEQIKDFLPEEKWQDYEDALTIVLHEMDIWKGIAYKMRDEIKELNKVGEI